MGRAGPMEVMACSRRTAAHTRGSHVQRLASAPTRAVTSVSARTDSTTGNRAADFGSVHPERNRRDLWSRGSASAAEPATQIKEILQEGLQIMEHEASMLSWERASLQKQLDVLIERLEHSDLVREGDSEGLADSSKDNASDGMVASWQAHVPMPLEKRKTESMRGTREILPMTLGQARSLHKRSVAAEERAMQFSEEIIGKLYELEEQDRCTRWAGA